MASRKTVFTLPITTYEEAFLATIPLPPDPLPRKHVQSARAGQSQSKQRRPRRSRWGESDCNSYLPHVNGYGCAYNDLSEGEYLGEPRDMFRPPTPLEWDDSSPSKLSIPQVIVTQGDRKGSFEELEFSMYYEHNLQANCRINSKNLVVPSMVTYSSSAPVGDTNVFLPCSRLAKQADELEKWLDGFWSEKDPPKSDETTVTSKNYASPPRLNGENASVYSQKVNDDNGGHTWYQNNLICNDNSNQINGNWESPTASKVKLGKFKFLRNEHCSELIATSNRGLVNYDLSRTTKQGVSDDSDSGWATVASSDAEEPHQSLQSSENEETYNTQSEIVGSQKTTNGRRRKGGSVNSAKGEPPGERRRSSRIRSMEERREKEREKLREAKEPADDGVTNCLPNSTNTLSNKSETESNKLSVQLSEGRPSTPPTLSPSPTSPSASCDLEESIIPLPQDDKSKESSTRTDGEFVVPPSPWNGMTGRYNHYKETFSETATGAVSAQGNIGPVKVKSRWRRCSEMEGVFSDTVVEKGDLSNLNGVSSNIAGFYSCPPPPPPPPLMHHNVNGMNKTQPPPPVGFFSPGEITEDWSEQDVTTSLTKNPLPLRLRPVPPVTQQSECKGLVAQVPPPPPPKEKPPYQNYEETSENIYLSSRLRSKARKEVRRMVCDCTLTKDEIKRGCLGCGEDCLNRLLMMECGSRCPTGDRCSNRKFQKKEYAFVEPFKTDKKGWGLKCNQDLPEGVFVIEYVGEVLDQREFKKRVKEYAADKQRHHYFMALKADQIIDATQKGNFSRFINHSCDPNCETQKWTVSGELRIGFFTRKPVTAGEEITFDYQFQRYGKEAQRCYCESSNCRGLIGGEKQTPLKKDKEKKDKKKRNLEERRREFGEDLDITSVRSLIEWTFMKLQEEIEKVNQLKGLTNRYQTLNLCRLMVRADDIDSRTILLCCLQRTEETACLRLFLDYHGLSLIWSWMMDTGNSESYTSFKAEVLKTLTKLPITSRNMVMESKLMPVIQKWSTQILDLESTRKQENTEVNVEENQSKLKECATTQENDIKVEKDNELCVHDESLWTDAEICPSVPQNEETIDSVDHVEFSEASKSPPISDENSTDVQMNSGDEITPALDEKTEAKDFEVKMEEELVDSVSRSSSEDTLTNSIAAARNTVENEILTVEKMEICNDCIDTNSDKIDETKGGTGDADVAESGKESQDGMSVVNAEALEESNLVASVANLASSLLNSWGELQQVYRIPKREQAQNRRDHEREADGSDDDDEDDDDERDQESDRNNKDKDEDESQHDKSRRQRNRDRNRSRRSYYSRKRRKHSNSQPRISKEERRQLFEQKVQQEEQEALRWQQAEYYRQQQEAQMEAQAQMELYYSAGYANLSGQTIAYYDPASGYAIPAIAAPGDLSVEATPTVTPDISASGIPPVGTVVPAIIPQVVPLDPTVASPIAGVPAVVTVPPVEGPVPPPAVFDSTSSLTTPAPVPAPVVYPIYPPTANPASTGYIANSQAAPFVTPQGQPIYYPPPQGVVVHLPDQTTWPHIIPTAVENPPSAPIESPKPVKLPPNWKTAKDEEGNLYYYHTVTRQTQWDPPTCEEGELPEETVPVDNHKSKKSASDSSNEHSRRIKESFRSKMSQFIVQYLNPYRKPDCKQGRIASTEEFKHLARKLTHFVMAKELKYCRNVEDLECNENVKHKAKDFVRKYMAKFGANYKKTASPKEDDE